MLKVFIDGREGTTGLQIEERLAGMPGIELLPIDPEKRKDTAERARLLNASDAAFLCLPDAAAIESVSLVTNPKTVIIDASTAHRTNPAWAYGFPELSEVHRQTIRSSNRIAVPGCYASGFCALVYPLVTLGIIARDAALSCAALSGYSGGGKSMIARYEGENPPRGGRPYAFGLSHKHLPEMWAVCGLDNPPVFMPAVVPVRQGMIVSVPLAMPAKPLWESLSAHYAAPGDVTVRSFGGEDFLDVGALDMEACNNTDRMDIFVFGHEKQALLVARLDNLGKGASGAAVGCLRERFGL